MTQYIAFLRGINVSGHHKVPMADLRKEMEALHFSNVVTILNSGNVIFNAKSQDIEAIEVTVSGHIEKVFGFPIPTIIRHAKTIVGLIDNSPFLDTELTKDLRFYISFLQKDVETDLAIPWTSDDASFQIIEKRDKAVFSILNVAISKTPKGMLTLERNFGKNITTRNWNTIKRLEKKIGSVT